MVVAVFFFTALDSILRHLSQRHDVFFLSFARNLFQVLWLTSLMPVVGARIMVTTRHPFVQLLRGAILVSTTVLIVMALHYLPMAQTYAITFSAPLMAVVLAALFLNERTSFRRYLWIVVGFLGVLIAINPGAPGTGWHLLIPLVMAFANAVFHVLTRAIAGDDDPMAMIFLSAAAGTLITSLTLPWSWSPMSLAEWALIGFGGLLGTIAHLLLTRAYRLAPLAVVSPMVYTQIVWASLFGFFLFGESPTLTTFVGAAVVAAAGVVLVRMRS